MSTPKTEPPTKPEPAKAETRASVPPPPPTDPVPPKPSLEQIFVSRLAGIFAGNRTPEVDLFEPVQQYEFGPLDRDFDFVGVVNDPRARELYSLGMLLKEEALALRQPRKRVEIEAYRRKVAILKDQSAMAMGLFAQLVRATLPKTADIKDGNLAVFEEWRVGVEKNPEGRLRDAMSQIFSGTSSGLSGLVERLELLSRGREGGSPSDPRFVGAPEGD